MSRVRIYQDPHEKKRRGPAKCPWSAEWRENGRRRSKVIGTKAEAGEFATIKSKELRDRREGKTVRKLWSEFVREYEARKIAVMRSEETQQIARRSLSRFAELVRPKWVNEVDRRALDEFVAKRLVMPARSGGTVSAETVKKELRHLRAALNVAVDWKYLAAAPKLPRVLGHATDKRFITESHFNAIVRACDVARLPDPRIHRGIEPAAWWRALLATMWVSGMRIGGLLALRWGDADLDQGTVWSRSRTNKGKRDTRHNVAAAVTLLTAIRTEDPRLFPWNHRRETLWAEFHRIQVAAKIDLPCLMAGANPGHACTPRCHTYGFHDGRRAHATYNYGQVDDRALQQQMGHASFATTQQYIKYAELHAADSYPAHVPDSLRQEQRENSGNETAGKPSLRVVG